MITTQKALRALFWQTFPDLPRRRIRDYSGTGLMHCIDTRCAWVDWIDFLERAGDISPALAARATL
jgi:hypothetical protein